MLSRTLLVWPEIALARQFGSWRMLGWLVGGCSVYVRLAALAELLSRGTAIALTAYIVAKVVAVAAMIALAWVMRPVDPAAFRFGLRLNTPVAAAAMGAGLLVSLGLGMRIGCVLAIGAYLIVRAMRAWFEWKRRGITGDGLLVCVLAVETFALIALAGLQPLWR